MTAQRELGRSSGSVDYGYFWLRLGATGYYGIVCGFEFYRFAAIILGREVTDDLMSVHLIIFAFLAFTGWCLVPTLRRMSDRIAAVLYAVFYSGRVGIHLLHGRVSAVLQGIECAVIITGLIFMTRGLIESLATGRPQRELSR